MTIERKLARLFRLDHDGWGRHANPLSVWSRYSVLPLFLAAIWLRHYSITLMIVVLILAVVWTFINPIIFSKPKDASSWATNAVLGEQVYLNRDRSSLPEHHQIRLYQILKITASVGVFISLWGAYSFNITHCVYGVLITYLAKSWFLDRMVWLYHDNVEKAPANKP